MQKNNVIINSFGHLYQYGGENFSQLSFTATIPVLDSNMSIDFLSRIKDFLNGLYEEQALINIPKKMNLDKVK